MAGPGKLVAIGNLKGGVGKTTLAISIAAAMAEGGKAVVVDADAQASATAWAVLGKLPVEVVTMPVAAEGERAVAAWGRFRIRVKSGHKGQRTPKIGFGSEGWGHPVAIQKSSFQPTKPRINHGVRKWVSRKSPGPHVFSIR